MATPVKAEPGAPPLLSPAHPRLRHQLRLLEQPGKSRYPETCAIARLPGALTEKHTSSSSSCQCQAPGIVCLHYRHRSEI